MSGRAAVSHLLIAVGIGTILGLVSIQVSTLYALGLLVVILLAVAALARPELALLALLVFTSTIISPKRIPSFDLAFGTLYVTDVLLLFLFGIIAVRALVEPDFRIVRTPLDYPLLFFVGAWLLAAFVAVWQERMPFDQTLGDVRTILTYLTFFCVTNLIRKREQYNFLWQGLVALGAFVAVAMIAQFATGTSQVLVAGRVELLGTEGRTFAGITRIIPPGESVMIVTFLGLVARIAMSERILANVQRLLLAGLLAVGILLTFFRSSWVASSLAVVLLLILVRSPERRRLIRWGVIAVLSTLAVVLVLQTSQTSAVSRLPHAVLDRLGTLGASETYQDPESSLRWRDFEYALAVPQILANPVVGIGPGARYRPWVQGKDHALFDGRAFIHNGHLNILVKSGLLGYLGIVWLSFVFLSRGLRLWKRVSDPQMSGMVLAFTLIYGGVLITSVVEPNIAMTHWAPVIGIMMGMNEVAFRSGAQGATLSLERNRTPTNA